MLRDASLSNQQKRYWREKNWHLWYAVVGEPRKYKVSYDVVSYVIDDLWWVAVMDGEVQGSLGLLLHPFILRQI